MLTDNWRDWAACRGKQDIFLAGDRTSDRGRTYESKFDRMVTQRAKEICYTCPVQDECLQFALAERIPYFVFGGLSWSERQKVLRIRHRNRPILVDSPPEAVFG